VTMSSPQTSSQQMSSQRTQSSQQTQSSPQTQTTISGRSCSRFGPVSLRGLQTIVFSLAAFFILPTLLPASTIAYDNDTSLGDVGFLQNWPGVLGLDFNVNKAITVTALGAYDQGVVANLAGVDGTSGVTVGIYDRTTQTLVSPTALFTPASPGVQINGDAFKAESFTLLPGEYSVVSYNDKNYNEGYVSNVFNPTSTENSGGGAISFVGSGRYAATAGLTYPTQVDGGPSNRYDAGTFAFVPEPSSYVLLIGAAIGGLAWRVRRRSPVTAG
jgi:hypothetical protein